MGRRLDWEAANGRDLVRERGSTRAEPEPVEAGPPPPAELARQFRDRLLSELEEYSKAKRRGESRDMLRCRSNHIFRVRREMEKALRLSGIPDRPPSRKQLAYLRDLSRQVGVEYERPRSRRQAQGAIDKLVRLEAQAQNARFLTKVPSGPPLGGCAKKGWGPLALGLALTASW